MAKKAANKSTAKSRRSKSNFKNQSSKVAKNQSKSSVPRPNIGLGRLRSALLVLLAASAVFVAAALLSYQSTDSSWSVSNNGTIENMLGPVGAIVADVCLSFLGVFAYTLPILLLVVVVMSYQERKKDQETGWLLFMLHLLGAVLFLLSGSVLCQLAMAKWIHYLPQGPGGILGQALVHNIMPYLSLWGTALVAVAVLLVSLTLLVGMRWTRPFALITRRSKTGWASYNVERKVRAQERRALKQQRKEERALVKAAMAAEAAADREYESEQQYESPQYDMPENSDISFTPEPQAPEQFDDAVPFEVPSEPIIKRVVPAKSHGHPDLSGVEAAQSSQNGHAPRQIELSGDVPSISLLDPPEPPQGEMSNEALEHMAAMVEQKLSDFGVKVQVVGVCPGPVVTRYELQLAAGVKVSKLSGLAKDLARALAAHSVRILEVIPGKSVVGIEIPNENRQIVRLSQILDTETFLNHPSVLAMGLGQDISGEAEVVDLGKMPHLLVAGTTGSGKSVGLNAMILSMLLKATPNELRLIMIDPKMLELSVYDGIPHLLTPVVTDMKQASNALRWCVKEMDRRYLLMSKMGVRNIAGFNQKIVEGRAEDKPLKDPLWLLRHPDRDPADASDLEPLPYIVVYVDELADMMMVVGKTVEELIARIAQKARASGIHLVLATQRPSVDVITGLIKANIPTRMAFQVSSKIDSRTIIDQQGAEQLLGHGDMLYLPPGSGIPTRVHGAYVADHEVHTIVSAWREIGEPDYIDSILETSSIGEGGDGDSGDGSSGSDAESDPMYDQAVQIVIETKRASISGIQRRLKIGYNRAARLIEQMEASGLVTPMGQNGTREVITSRQADEY